MSGMGTKPHLSRQTRLALLQTLLWSKIAGAVARGDRARRDLLMERAENVELEAMVSGS